MSDDFPSLSRFVSADVRQCAGHHTWREEVCHALPVSSPAMPVLQRLQSDACGSVVVQVLLPWPHLWRLQLPQEPGAACLRAGPHLPPGLLWQQPNSPDRGLRTRPLPDPVWVLQRTRHLHHQQYISPFLLCKACMIDVLIIISE